MDHSTKDFSTRRLNDQTEARFGGLPCPKKLLGGELTAHNSEDPPVRYHIDDH
jgi:hypothetical protein